MSSNEFYEKDFDSWNEMKKVVQVSHLPKNFFYHKREIWWCTLGTNVGYEQDGRGTECERPVLVLRGFSANACLIVPLSTSIKKNPYYVRVGKVDGRDASAIVSQVRLVDTRRFKNKIGMLDASIFETIRKVVKDLL